MNWNEIKELLVVPSIDGIDKLLANQAFWTSPEEVIFSTTSYLYKNKRFNDAIRLIEATRKLNCPLSVGMNLQFCYLRADILLDTGNHEAAAAAYDEIIATSSTEVALANRALAKWEMNLYAEALEDYLQAYKMNASNPIVCRGVGEMMIKTGNSKGAVPFLQKALQLDQEYSQAYTALGVALFNCEEWVDAYESFREAIKRNPCDQKARMGIQKIDSFLE